MQLLHRTQKPVRHLATKCSAAEVTAAMRIEPRLLRPATKAMSEKRPQAVFPVDEEVFAIPLTHLSGCKRRCHGAALHFLRTDVRKLNRR